MDWAPCVYFWWVSLLIVDWVLEGPDFLTGSYLVFFFK